MSPSARKQAPLLSVLVPTYNDGHLLEASLRRVAAVEELDREVLVVDDGSTDGTANQRKSLLDQGLANRWLSHPRNRGKGAALRTALAEAQGAIVAVHDADLEYDPSHLPELVAPVADGQADAVFGSRWLGSLTYGFDVPRRPDRILWDLGSELINISVSLAVRRRITDVETCQKVIRTDLLRSLGLREERFGFEPEVTLKLVLAGARILEMPVRYQARSWAEGKKIGLRDGFEALGCVVRYGLLGR